jgi:hypothetical protein
MNPILFGDACDACDALKDIQGSPIQGDKWKKTDQEEERIRNLENRYSTTTGRFAGYVVTKALTR